MPKVFCYYPTQGSIMASHLRVALHCAEKMPDLIWFYDTEEEV